MCRCRVPDRPCSGCMDHRRRPQQRLHGHHLVLQIGAEDGEALALLILDPDLHLVLGVGIATLVGSQEFWLGVILMVLALVVPTMYLVSLLATPLMLGDSAKLEQEYRLTLSDAGIHFRSESIDSRIAWREASLTVRVRMACQKMSWTRYQFTKPEARLIFTRTGLPSR